MRCSFLADKLVSPVLVLVLFWSHTVQGKCPTTELLLLWRHGISGLLMVVSFWWRLWNNIFCLWDLCAGDVFREPERQEINNKHWSKGTAGSILPRIRFTQVLSLALIQPLVLPGVIPKCRIRSKPWELLGVALKQTKQILSADNLGTVFSYSSLTNS